MRITLIFCLWCTALCSQNRSVAPGVSIPYFTNVIAYLASDSMKGRLPGSNEEKLSAQFIAEELKRSGCTPVKKKRFVYPFNYFGADSVQVYSAGNVVARINTPSKECIVISAHYDHIGYGHHHSNDPFSRKIHNGADDNASGVAMMLALANWCKEHKGELQYDIVFAAFSGEEDGLFGSIDFLKGKVIDTSTIFCNINFDMVGHLDAMRPLLTAEGAKDSEFWKRFMPSDTNVAFMVHRTSVEFKDGSDHCTFKNAGIPALLISTGITQMYHRPIDDPETINYQGMVAIGLYIEELLLKINNNPVGN